MRAMGPLFIAIFIDGMGLGILFPLLNALFIDPTGSILPLHTAMATRNFYYGLTVGLFMLAWFFGATILGDLSDHIGRKKALVACLLGSFVGYGLSAVAVLIHSVPLLAAGRLIDGFTAGSQPIAQAAIVDLSDPEHKTRNIGLILFASSCGFIFGPLIGGVLSDAAIYHGFDYTTPLYFACLVTLLNALLLMVLFKESFEAPKEKIKIRLRMAIDLFISAFRKEDVRQLSIVYFIFMLGWATYFIALAMFLYMQFHYSPGWIGIFMAVLGAGFGFATGVLVQLLSSRCRLTSLLYISLFLLALGVLLPIVIDWRPVAWITAFTNGATAALAYTAFIAVYSNRVSKDHQGWVMGITNSISAAAFAIMSFSAGLIADLSHLAPMLTSAVALGISTILMFMLRKRY